MKERGRERRGSKRERTQECRKLGDEYMGVLYIILATLNLK